jgi:predicted transposase/invertase (TIGR01784 family)
VTEFKGIHEEDDLALSDRQKEVFRRRYPRDIFPEYYLLKLNNFNDVARDALDEWIYFLKNEEIKGEFRARGLDAAKEVLDIMHLSAEELKEYERHAEDLMYQKSMFLSSYGVGKMEGVKEGLEKGLEKGRKEGLEEGLRKAKEEIAGQLLDVLDDETISRKTGLSVEDVRRIRNRR